MYRVCRHTLDVIMWIVGLKNGVRLERVDFELLMVLTLVIGTDSDTDDDHEKDGGGDPAVDGDEICRLLPNPLESEENFGITDNKEQFV